MIQGLFSLKDRIALVTGAAQGIGFSIAKGLAEAGAHVVLNGRDINKLAAARTSIEAEGGACSLAPFDVTDQNAALRGVEDVIDALGSIDILVNNAGMQKRAAFTDFERDDWNAIVATNLSSVFFVTQVVARDMMRRNRGNIINIGSVMSELGRRTIVPYTATKGAIKMMTRGLAAELGPHNIQVNAIGPGYFRTELNKALVENPDFSAWLESRTPAGRWGEVSELVGAAVFLSSAASDYVNGHLLMVDGGLTASV